MFDAGFFRLDMNPATLWYNTRLDFDDQSPGSELVVDTDATQMQVELRNTLVSVVQGSTIPIYIDGRLLTPDAGGLLTPAQTNGAPEFQTVTLPSGMKRVRVEGGAYYQTNYLAGPDVGRTGTIVQALEFPIASTTYLPPPPRSSMSSWK